MNDLCYVLTLSTRGQSHEVPYLGGPVRRPVSMDVVVGVSGGNAFAKGLFPGEPLPEGSYARIRAHRREEGLNPGHYVRLERLHEAGDVRISRDLGDVHLEEGEIVSIGSSAGGEGVIALENIPLDYRLSQRGPLDNGSRVLAPESMREYVFGE